MLVQQFFAEGAIGAFDIDVLVGLARLGVLAVHAVGLGPFDEYLAQKFRAIVGMDDLPKAARERQVLEHAHHAQAGDHALHLERDGFVVSVVDDRQVLDESLCKTQIKTQKWCQSTVRISVELVSSASTGACRRLPVPLPRSR